MHLIHLSILCVNVDLNPKVGEIMPVCLMFPPEGRKQSQIFGKYLSEMVFFGGDFGYGYDMMNLGNFGYISRSYIHFGKRIYIQIIYPVIGYISWI